MIVAKITSWLKILFYDYRKVEPFMIVFVFVRKWESCKTTK